MSNRLFPAQVMALNRESKEIAISFAPNGASNPLVASITGLGWKSIVHTATGVWTITLQDGYKALISAVGPTLALNAVATTALQYGLINVTSAGTGKNTIVVNAINSSSGAATDIAANANNRISVRLIVQNA